MTLGPRVCLHHGPFGGLPPPAISGAVALTARGGDFSLRLGQEASIGYLSHTATDVQLYLQETLTFLAFTAEAAVSLPARA